MRAKVTPMTMKHTKAILDIIPTMDKPSYTELAKRMNVKWFNPVIFTVKTLIKAGIITSDWKIVDGSNVVAEVEVKSFDFNSLTTKRRDVLKNLFDANREVALKTINTTLGVAKTPEDVRSALAVMVDAGYVVRVVNDKTRAVTFVKA